MVLTNEELAYFAGIMDGEGTFSIVIRRRGKYNWYQDSIAVRMGEQPVIKKLHEKLGGRYYERDEVGKTTFIWQMSSKEARKICNLLLPYLILKKRQAEIIIEMGEIKQIGKRFQSDPEHIKNKKFELYHELKQSHQRNYLFRQR